jgi:hypothetical protein
MNQRMVWFYSQQKKRKYYQKMLDGIEEILRENFNDQCLPSIYLQFAANLNFSDRL